MKVAALLLVLCVCLTLPYPQQRSVKFVEVTDYEGNVTAKVRSRARQAAKMGFNMRGATTKGKIWRVEEILDGETGLRHEVELGVGMCLDHGCVYGLNLVMKYNDGKSEYLSITAYRSDV